MRRPLPPFSNTASLGIAWFSLITSMFLWGSAFSVMKLLLLQMTPVTMMIIRMVLGCLLIIPIALYLKIKIPKREHLGLFLLMAFLEPCLYFLLESYAVLYTTATEVGLMMSLIPISTALAAWLFLGEKSTRFSILCLIACIIGVSMLTLGSHKRPEATFPILGNLLAIGAVFCSTGYIIVVKKLAPKYQATTLLSFQLVVGTIFFAFWWVVEGCLTPSISTSNLLLLFYLGIFVSIGAYGLFTISLSILPATSGGAATNLIPIVAIFFGFFVLNEQLSEIQWGGASIILLALLVREINQSSPAIFLKIKNRLIPF